MAYPTFFPLRFPRPLIRSAHIRSRPWLVGCYPRAPFGAGGAINRRSRRSGILHEVHVAPSAADLSSFIGAGNRRTNVNRRRAILRNIEKHWGTTQLTTPDHTVTGGILGKSDCLQCEMGRTPECCKPPRHKSSSRIRRNIVDLNSAACYTSNSFGNVSQGRVSRFAGAQSWWSGSRTYRTSVVAAQLRIESPR